MDHIEYGKVVCYNGSNLGIILFLDDEHKSVTINVKREIK